MRSALWNRGVAGLCLIVATIWVSYVRVPLATADFAQPFQPEPIDENGNVIAATTSAAASTAPSSTPPLVTESQSSAADSAAEVSSADSAIGPLDDWGNVRPLNLGSSQDASSAESRASGGSSSKEHSYMDAEYYGFSEEEDPANERPSASHLLLDGTKEEKQEIFEVPYRLTTADRKMFERVDSRIRRLASRYQREQAKKNFLDRRGEAEVTACSVNLRGYGTKNELKVVLKRKLPVSASRKLADALVRQGCEVIALQGVIARSKKNAEAAVLEFRDVLEKQSSKEWQFFVGDIDRGTVFSALLLQRGRLRLSSLSSFGETYLPRYAPFTLKKFPSAPMMISFVAPGKEGKRDREIVLLSFFVGERVDEPSKSNSAKQKQVVKNPPIETVLNSMQIAEALRQTIEMKQRQANSDDSPIVIVAGERNDTRTGVVSRILEGRQQLRQFKVNGNCRLTEEFKVECNEPVQLPQLLFEVGSYTEPPRKRVHSNRLTSDIYLFHEDLPYAYREQYSTGDYAGYFVKQEFGKEQVVIHVLRLNW